MPILTSVDSIDDRSVLPSNSAHHEAEDLQNAFDGHDPDLEFHVVLLLARMSRDLYAMLYEPPDLSTRESAADSVVRCDRLLAAIESHCRTIRVLRNLLQEKQRRGTLPRKSPPTPRGR